MYYCKIVCVLFIVISFNFFWYIVDFNILCYFVLVRSIFGFLYIKLYDLCFILVFFIVFFLMNVVLKLSFVNLVYCLVIILIRGVIINMYVFGYIRGKYL